MKISTANKGNLPKSGPNNLPKKAGPIAVQGKGKGGREFEGGKGPSGHRAYADKRGSSAVHGGGVQHSYSVDGAAKMVGGMFNKP